MKGLNTAARQAAKSTHKFRMGAVIVKGGRVVSTGYNVVGHRSQYREWESIHAEEQAIVKLLRSGSLDLLANSVLYVSRINNRGELACSKPCRTCFSLIQSVGIKKVVFINELNEVDHAKVCALP